MTKKDSEQIDGNDRKQLVLKGTPVAGGITSGNVYRLCHADVRLKSDEIKSEQVGEHLHKYEDAIERLHDELKLTQRLAALQKQSDSELIIDTQIQILLDPDLEEQITDHIQSKLLPADRAIWDAFQLYIDLIEQTRNDIMIERIPDIRDVRNRLIRFVQRSSGEFMFSQGSVIVADEITPSEVIHASRNKVKGLVCNTGGLTSHSAILAHAMEIPMVIGVKHATSNVKNGELIALNADNGEVYIRPDEALLDDFLIKEADRKEERSKLMSVLAEPNTLSCGHKFELLANMEFSEEIPTCKKYKPQGIGLLRTESLILSDDQALDEEKQLEFYRTMAEAVDKKVLTIRLFDIGGDKLNPFEKQESNPFLGWRGVRVLLDKPNILHDQLRAILRVSGEYPDQVRILVPMISWVEEMQAIHAAVAKVKEELDKDDLKYDPFIKVGAMVEVPSMVVQADKFANHVDFFSVGTNDLTQYILAVDRGNTLISHLYQQIHPAVFRAVAYAVRAAKSKQVDISVCGEAASDPIASMAFLGLGINRLSMTPNEIPRVKDKLRKVSFEDCKQLTTELLNAESMAEVKQIIEKRK